MTGQPNYFSKLDYNTSAIIGIALGYILNKLPIRRRCERGFAMRRVWNRLFDLTGLRGKTLWDWMSLLIVPLILALAGWVLSGVGQQIESQARIEDNRIRQNVLESYLRDMTTLLLDKGLVRSEFHEPIRKIARANTLSAVRQLDGACKGLLLQFLYEPNLISHSDYQFPGLDYKSPNNPIILLRGADLSGADLSLSALNGTDLTLVNLSGADLSYSFVESAVLNRAELIDSTLRGTCLRDTDLSGANLRDAEGWTEQQLAQAESLIGATLPDGTVMAEEAWEDFKKKYRQ
jgi:uncharacterized protein YjbI with pentapeptide repeats